MIRTHHMSGVKNIIVEIRQCVKATINVNIKVSIVCFRAVDLGLVFV